GSRCSAAFRTEDISTRSSGSCTDSNLGNGSLILRFLSIVRCRFDRLPTWPRDGAPHGHGTRLSLSADQTFGFWQAPEQVSRLHYCPRLFEMTYATKFLARAGLL